MKPKTSSALTTIVRALRRSQNKEVPLEAKRRLAEIILRVIEQHREPFGLLIILGWHNRWKRYAVTPDISQDLFAGRNISRVPTVAERKRLSIRTTVNFDGAILIDSHGTVLHSGVMIEGLWPRKVANIVRPGKFKDLSTQFGFKEKIHTRHLTGITASYTFKGTTIFAVSEETGSIHIFENGKILYATKQKRRK